MRILLVHSRGGPPLDYALPRIATRAEIWLLALRPVPARTESLWRPYCAAVISAHHQRAEGDELAELIEAHARRIRADAIMTFSEFAVTAVAQAAAMMGLPGAGEEVIRSRDKRLMRATWKAAGVTGPAFRPVSSAAEVRTAFRELTPPLLLKSAWGAGSVGQLIIDSEEAIEAAWTGAKTAVADADSADVIALAEPGARDGFLVEEIIPGTTRSWWEEGSGYGDYLSVEGIVVEGVYHPLCITSRLPTIPPFTEVCNVAPCVLPAHLQREVEAFARAAVDALRLRTCGTHTEIKLLDGGRLSAIESAARIGGAMITAQIEHVFGYDPVGALTDALLGLPPRLPGRMLTDRDARGAACTISLLATDAAGRPWARDLVWDSRVIDWSRMVSPGTRVEAVQGMTIPDGTRMPRYQLSSGAQALGGVLFLRAPDAATAIRDARAVLDNLEHVLADGWSKKGMVTTRVP